MADDKESEGISIGASAEAILCTGVWDDGVDNDFEPTNWVMATLQAPAVGGTLELKGEKDPEGGETQTEIKYSSTLFDAFDVELETDHTFGDGTKLTVSNSSLVPNVELKVESEMNDSKEFSHTLSAVCNKIGGPFLFFDFASLAAKYNVADKELQAEVGGHSEHTSLVIEATHSLEESSTSYSATAELRGDTCTLSMRYNPNADEAEQKVAALHATVAEGTEVAVSANSNKEWLVGVQKVVDDDTTVKMRLGVKPEMKGDSKPTSELHCCVSRQVSPELNLRLVGNIDTQNLNKFNAHKFGLQALYEM